MEIGFYKNMQHLLLNDSKHCSTYFHERRTSERAPVYRTFISFFEPVICVDRGLTHSRNILFSNCYATGPLKTVHSALDSLDPCSRARFAKPSYLPFFWSVCSVCLRLHRLRGWWSLTFLAATFGSRFGLCGALWKTVTRFFQDCCALLLQEDFDISCVKGERRELFFFQQRLALLLLVRQYRTSFAHVTFLRSFSNKPAYTPRTPSGMSVSWSNLGSRFSSCCKPLTQSAYCLCCQTVGFVVGAHKLLGSGCGRLGFSCVFLRLVLGNVQVVSLAFLLGSVLLLTQQGLCHTFVDFIPTLYGNW